MTVSGIAVVLAGQLAPEHLGRQVAFYAEGKRQVGVLEAIYRPRQGFRTLTLSSGRVREVTGSTEVDVIEVTA